MYSFEALLQKINIDNPNGLKKTRHVAVFFI